MEKQELITVNERVNFNPIGHAKEIINSIKESINKIELLTEKQ